jgi:uncharacterized protein (DUF427 family)
MVQAIWKGTVVAESDETVEVEGNQYFPPDSVKPEFLELSDKRTTCPWKGVATYYDITINGDVNEDAAWTYPEPKEAARHIQGYVAFWKGVQVRS